MPTPTPIDTGRDPVVVIGGGLAGLYAAWRLTQAGANVVLLEAQQRLGGRILSASLPGLAHSAGAAYDLGPTWYWPALQTRMPRLIRRLDLHAFEQPADGAALFESSPAHGQRMANGPAMAGSMRLHGGMACLITVLARHALTRAASGLAIAWSACIGSMTPWSWRWPRPTRDQA